MRLVHKPESTLIGCAVTIGTFDGVHLAHQLIIRRVRDMARKYSVPAGLLTFNPPPAAVFNTEFLYFLTTREEKKELLAGFGLDFTYELEFTRELGLLEPEPFFSRYIWDPLHPKAVVVGADHRFGRERRGDTSLLGRLAHKLGFNLKVVPQYRFAGSPVSATRVREKLLLGNVRVAGRLLGRHYSLTGRVVSGDRRGKVLGFPTTNLALPAREKLVPADGVYAVWLDCGPARHMGVMNIGYRPTFGSTTRHLEAHIIDHSVELYGRTLTVHFVERLRAERRFDDAAALRVQIEQDIARAKEILRSDG